MENINLLDRLQQRAKSTTLKSSSREVTNVNLYDEAHENSSESDIDDDITLQECEDFIKQREGKLYTKIKAKSTEINSSRSTSHSSYGIPDQETKENFTSLSNRAQVNQDALTSSTRQPNDISSKISVSENVDFDFCTNVKQKRKVLSAEERKVIKQQKEKEKLEKQKKREDIKLQKEIEKERLKALKDRDRMASRSEKKDECMDRILAVVDPCLVQEVGGGDILKDLQDMNIRYELKALPVVCCIGWMREAVEYKVDCNRKVEKSSSYTEEANIIHKITAYELATRIEAQSNLQNEEETFLGLVKTLKKTFPLKKITVVVVGINAYHRLVKTKQNEAFRNKALGGDEPAVKRKKKEQLVPKIMKEEIEKHLIDLQITTNISIRFCEDMSNVSKLVSSFTKAMAEAPFRKTPVSSLEFSTMLSSKAVFKISNDGHGISQVWNQQLQQFYGVRNDTSTSITQLYPTPLSLLKAYQNLSQSEGEKLLQDVQVRRGVGVLQTQRRVGPELSKKIYKLFTSLDGNEALGK